MPKVNTRRQNVSIDKQRAGAPMARKKLKPIDTNSLASNPEPQQSLIMNDLDYENRVLKTRQELLRSKLQHLRTLDQTIANQQQHVSTSELTDPSKTFSDSISDLDIMLAELTLKPPMPP